MDGGTLATQLWQSLTTLLGTMTFWLYMAASLAMAYIAAFVISRLRLRRTSPVNAAYEGAIWGLWIAFLIIAAVMYFFWQSDFVALTLALIIVVVVPWAVVAALKARGDEEGAAN